MYSLKTIKGFLIQQIDFITRRATERTTCKRKGVGCQLITIRENEMRSWDSVYNGPSRPDFECTDIVGNCGCMHSEPRAIIKAFQLGLADTKFIMLCTYSPCTNCANIILQSGIIEGVVYKILTEHDKRGDEFLRKSIDVLTTKELLTGKSDVIIRKWIKTNSEY